MLHVLSSKVHLNLVVVAVDYELWWQCAVMVMYCNVNVSILEHCRQQ